MSALTPDSIRELVSENARSCLDILEIFPQIDSTNAYLLDGACPAPSRCRVVLAEYQTAGRGRMNRVWHSPPSTGLCLSMAYTFRSMPDEFPSLSLAIGIGVAQALERLGIDGIGLKWPNDIVAKNGKLGGVLPDVHTARADGVTIVIGIGLNIDLRNNEAANGISSSLGGIVDLASCCDELPSRSVIAAAIIEALLDTMHRFGATGFATFHALWQKYDWLRGQEVMIETADLTNAGVAEGVDSDGALLLNTGGGRRRITSGSVILGRRTGTRP